jgi:hypothetical protein
MHSNFSQTIVTVIQNYINAFLSAAGKSINFCFGCAAFITVRQPHNGGVNKSDTEFCKIGKQITYLMNFIF